VNATIIGPRTVEQLRDNLGALEVRLSAEAVQALDEASAFATRLPRS
jgi:aryl-alcohol dehydrogenase-like predicted oxidoreductase